MEETKVINQTVRDFSKISNLVQTLIIFLISLLVPTFLGNLIKTIFGAESVITSNTQVIVGSIVYFVIRAVALEFDIDPSYMKLISAVIVALALAVPKFIEDFRNKRLYTPDDVEDTDSTGKEEA